MDDEWEKKKIKQMENFPFKLLFYARIDIKKIY